MSTLRISGNARHTLSPFPLGPPMPLLSIISALHPRRRKTRCAIYKPRPRGTSRWGGSLGWRVLGVASPVPQWLRYIPSLSASEGCAAWPGSPGGALPETGTAPRAPGTGRRLAGDGGTRRERAVLAEKRGGEKRAQRPRFQFPQTTTMTRKLQVFLRPTSRRVMSALRLTNGRKDLKDQGYAAALPSRTHSGDGAHRLPLSEGREGLGG